MFLDEISRKELGSFLRDQRLDLGLTQGDIAEQMGFESGQYVSNWERGICLPPKNFVDLSKSYKIPRKALAKVLAAEAQESIYRALKLSKKR